MDKKKTPPTFSPGSGPKKVTASTTRRRVKSKEEPKTSEEKKQTGQAAKTTVAPGEVIKGPNVMKMVEKLLKKSTVDEKTASKSQSKTTPKVKGETKVGLTKSSGSTSGSKEKTEKNPGKQVTSGHNGVPKTTSGGATASGSSDVKEKVGTPKGAAKVVTGKSPLTARTPLRKLSGKKEGEMKGAKPKTLKSEDKNSSKSSSSLDSDKKQSSVEMEDEVFDKKSPTSSQSSTPIIKKPPTSKTSNVKIRKSSSLRSLDRPVGSSPLRKTLSVSAGTGPRPGLNVKKKDGLRKSSSSGNLENQSGPLQRSRSVENQSETSRPQSEAGSESLLPPRERSGTSTPSSGSLRDQLSAVSPCSVDDARWQLRSPSSIMDDAIWRGEFEDLAALQKESLEIWGIEGEMLDGKNSEKTPRTMRQHRKEVYRKKLKVNH